MFKKLESPDVLKRMEKDLKKRGMNLFDTSSCGGIYHKITTEEEYNEELERQIILNNNFKQEMNDE